MPKHFSRQLKQSLYRKKPREIRGYASDFVNQYSHILDGFTKEEFIQYEDLLRRWGAPGRRTIVLLEKVTALGITGPILELAKIRTTDRFVHQKLIQIVRYRWTNLSDYKKEQLNQDEEKLWLRSAASIQKRCETDSRGIHPEWVGPEGRVVLANFLKELFEKQEGKCAISNEPMTITVGDGGKLSDTKASADRKNSNKGYTPDNIWLTCWWANQMKLDMPMITFWKRIET
jgi:hypothetical protein